MVLSLQCGNGGTVDLTVPSAVFLTGASAISLGDYHSCALIGGGVGCLGYNGYGQVCSGLLVLCYRYSDRTLAGANAVCQL